MLRVAKLVNASQSSPGYQIFMAVAKIIPDNSSKETALLAFNILSGTEPYMKLLDKLPASLVNSQVLVDTSQWKILQNWADWWLRPRVLKQLSKAFSDLSTEDWDDMPGTNKQTKCSKNSVPSRKRTVGRRVSVEFYGDSRTSTTWFKGTVISYSRKGYMVSFDGRGPEENEVIYSLNPPSCISHLSGSHAS